MTKLLFRTLPDYYPRRSAYAHFPFLAPSFMKTHLKTSNPTLVDKYVWTRPRPLTPVIPIDSFDSVKLVLDDTMNFIPAYDGHLFTCVQPLLETKMVFIKHLSDDRLFSDLFLSQSKIPLDFTKKAFLSGLADVSKSVFSKPDASIGVFFAETTKSLIREKQFSNGGAVAYLDIVKDVINLLPLHWISNELVSIGFAVFCYGLDL